jgi:hypothetical protein
MNLKYQNSGLELLGRMILWSIACFFIIPIPWVINDIFTYFAKGFSMEKGGGKK